MVAFAAPTPGTPTVVPFPTLTIPPPLLPPVASTWVLRQEASVVFLIHVPADQLTLPFASVIINATSVRPGRSQVLNNNALDRAME